MMDIEKDSEYTRNKGSLPTGEGRRGALAEDWRAPLSLSSAQRYFSELTNMACLTEEVGELARIMARTYGDQSFKKGESHDLGDEMADVLWVLLCLANQTGVDLTEAFRKNLEKKTTRDKTRHHNNNKLK